jgi:hypothetical protein
MFDAAHAKSDGHVLTLKSNQIHKHLQLNHQPECNQTSILSEEKNTDSVLPEKH